MKNNFTSLFLTGSLFLALAACGPDIHQQEQQVFRNQEWPRRSSAEKLWDRLQ